MAEFVETPAPSVQVEPSDGGTLLLRSGLDLAPVRQSLPHIFDEAADAHPQRAFVRDRQTPDGSWRDISYSEAQRAANGLAQWLIDHDVGFGDAVAYLSAPSIEHAIAAIGIQRCGAAIAPVSVAYSLLSADHGKLVNCVMRSKARYVIVDDLESYAGALAALSALHVEIIAVRGAEKDKKVTSFADVIATEPTEAVAERMAAITPDTIARIMYTSGSTGSPKATPQPQSNLTITVAQTEAIGLLDFDDEGPQILEAMPFSHIMAGNFNFNNTIRAAGTINIDQGKPTPELFEKTIANLKDVSPHYFITVPLGYAMLCDAMEADDALRDNFFRNLRYIGFGGAVLPDSVKDRLLSLSRAARGDEVPIFSFYGATEYLFGALKYWAGGSTEVIGLPLPGTELKLVPDGERYALWIRSPTVMPRSGYLGTPEASEGLFDEDGFFQTGDAVRFADEDDPAKGLVFAGRIADDFKLSSGTFVSVNALRQDLIAACEPALTEVVLCGLNENWVGALLWVKGDADRIETRETIENALVRFNAEQTGLSRRIGTALIMNELLSFDFGELTDKGNVAARVVRERRKADVQRLFADERDAAVIDLRP
ncbi:MAG: AMP-binding protein [Parasphingopyxis sp.]|uniref:AMP-binding protein n=1 Tax=Parasphingopyxis sp. TaxID=1920299 RepID=UPI0032EBA2EF